MSFGVKDATSPVSKGNIDLHRQRDHTESSGRKCLPEEGDRQLQRHLNLVNTHVIPKIISDLPRRPPTTATPSLLSSEITSFHSPPGFTYATPLSLSYVAPLSSAREMSTPLLTVACPALGSCPPLLTANLTSGYLFRILTAVETCSADCGTTTQADLMPRRRVDQ